MGNTGVALSADENALYYNPAGLGSVDSLMLNLSFMLEIPAISELQASQEKLSDGASTSIEMLHIRSLNSFSFILPFGDWFTVGAIYSLEYTYDFSVNIDQSGATDNEKTINTMTNSEIGLGMLEDGMFRYGIAVSPGSGQWVFGLQQNVTTRREQPFTSVKFQELTGDVLSASNLTTLTNLLAQAAANGADNLTLSEAQFIDNMTKEIQNLDVNELADSIQSKFTCYTSKKTANSYRLGFQRRATSASWLRMTFGAVAHNVGNLTYGNSDNCPRDQLPEYDIGFSAQPKFGPVRLLFAADLRDFTYANANDTYCYENKGSSGCLQKRFNWGWELGFLPIDSGANFVSVRGGVSQNRPTWGAEINPFIFFRFFTIEYAHYTESMGQEVGERTNARDVIQLRFAF
ncbi:MAG: hypothetical protein VW876_14270 [Deltaproteobacteria bacterium]